MKWIGLLLTSAAIGAGVIIAHQAELRTAGDSNSRTSEQSTSPSRPSRLFAAGIVEGLSREIPLHFELSGRLAAVKVHEGDRVEPGDVLAELDGAIWEQRVRRAEAQVRQAVAERDRLLLGAREETRAVAQARVDVARIALEGARQRFERAERLFARETLPEEEFDEIRHALEQAYAELQLSRAQAVETEAPPLDEEIRLAEARITAAEAELDEARLSLEKTKLRAPCRCCVVRLSAEPGQLVGPDDAEPVLTVVDDSALRIRAYAEEADALDVHIGQRAYITTDADPDRRIGATVVFCAPEMRPKSLFHQKPGERSDVKVREFLLAVDEPSNLVIGMPVDVFVLREGVSAKADPASPSQRLETAGASPGSQKPNASSTGRKESEELGRPEEALR